MEACICMIPLSSRYMNLVFDSKMLAAAVFAASKGPLVSWISHFMPSCSMFL